MKFIFALIVSIISSSCADPIKVYIDTSGRPSIFEKLPIRWRFDCEFPEENKQIIRNSFNYWQSLIKVELFKEDMECGFSLFFNKNTQENGIGIMMFPSQEKINVNNEMVEIWGRAPVATFKNGSKSGLILLYPVWDIENDDEVKESIARHEVGHILGFAHVSNSKCLMHETIRPTEKKKNVCLGELVKLQELYGRNKWDH